MRCRYCFYRDEMSRREQAAYGMMAEKTADAVVEKALAYVGGHGDLTMGFQGGEPTLRGIGFYRHLTDTVRALKPAGVRVFYALQTNGLLLDEEWAVFLKENGFLVGLSMDGTKDLHDRNRPDAVGKGTHQRVLKAAALLKAHGVPFNILTVVNRNTARAIDGIYTFYQKQGFAYQQYIPCLDPLGTARGGEPWSLTAEDYGRFLIRLFDRWFKDRMAGKFLYIHYFESLAGILAGHPGPCGMNGQCMLQTVIEADGSVYPCDFYALDAYRIGNILTDDFAVLEGRHEPFLAASAGGLDACADCRYRPLCRGGCRRDRQMADGLGPNYFCTAYRMFFDHALPGLLELTGGGRRT